MSEEKEGVPDKNSGEVPKEIDYKAVLDNWEELKGVPIQDFFAMGWRPRIKTKHDGSRYITIRGRTRDSDGLHHDSEKSFGPYDPERWQVIQSMYPKTLDSSLLGSRSELGKKKASKMLSTSISRERSIPASLSIDVDIIGYYQFLQQKGYDGSLQDFLHECVRNYFALNGVRPAIIIQPIGETP